MTTLGKSILFLLFAAFSVIGQSDVDRSVAARFAPVFYQALGDDPRADQITNFNFDGDWRGDNNWDNVLNEKFPLKAYVYYNVAETKTHYFVHYAVFHPRDYKGGAETGRLLSDLLGQGAKIVGRRDPTGLMDEATAAHENDLEGVLVVVEKGPDGGRVVFSETMRHNSFVKYSRGIDGSDGLKVDNERISFYIEPRGHGIDALKPSDSSQISGKQYLIYEFSGDAGTASAPASRVGYDLIPLRTTLWARARGTGVKATYGSTHNFGTVTLNVNDAKGKPAARKIKLGILGSAFLGSMGGKNMARPPWAWFDNTRRDDQLGLWFFDPATTIKRDFSLTEGFATSYVKLPYWATK